MARALAAKPKLLLLDEVLAGLNPTEVAKMLELIRAIRDQGVSINNFNELDYYIDLIHAELRNQYLIGYTPTNKVHDGKWRKIQVKLDPPEGLPKLTVHTKEGYNAPKN